MLQKCKNQLILIIILSYCCFAKAQYLPFIDPGKTWREIVEFDNLSGDWYLDDYQLTGDTIINSLTYQKLEMVNSTDPNIVLPVYSGAIREDITARTVHIVFPGHSTELLLYDFDINIGEQHTIHHCYYAWPIPSFPATFSVDSIGSYIDEYGLNRKVWYLNSAQFGIVTRIVEGIGSNSGIYSYSCNVGVWSNLVCVHKDSLVLFVNDFPYSVYCPFVQNGMEEPDLDSFELNIYPNPTKSNLTIEFGSIENITESTIVAFDQMGRMFQLNPTIQFNKATTDVADLPNGLYCLLIKTEEKTFTRKIIIAKN